jgi:hypothetical protein
MRTIRTFQGKNQLGASARPIDLRDYDFLYFDLLDSKVNILDLQISWEQYFEKKSNTFSSNIKIIENYILYFKEEIETFKNKKEYNEFPDFYNKIIHLLDQFISYLENEKNNFTSQNLKPFYFEIKSKKIHIETLQKTFSWNIYLQVLAYLYYNNKLPKSNDPFILETILKKTKLNNKNLLKQNKSKINTASEVYMFKAKIFNIDYNQNEFKEKLLSEEAIQFINGDFYRKWLEETLREFIITFKL